MGIFAMMNDRFANQDPIGNFNRGVEKMVGKKYYQESGMADTAYAFDRMMSLFDGQAQATKDIEDLFPMFYSICKDLDVFAKIYLQNECSSEIIYFRDIMELRLTDSDKFMIMRMHCQYNMLWDIDHLDITLVDGIPKSIHGNSRIIAKKIVGNRLTNEEAKQLSDLISKFKSDRSQFFYLLDYAYDHGSHPVDWIGWEQKFKARQTGWFPKMDPMSVEEYDWAIKNGFLDVSPKKKELPDHKVKKKNAIDLEPIIVSDASDGDANDELENAAFAAVIASSIKSINDILDEEDDDLSPSKETREEIIKETTNSAEFVIDMSFLNNLGEICGELVNNAGGIDQFVDHINNIIDDSDIDFIGEIKNIPGAQEVKELDNLSFNIGKMLKVLAKGVVPKTIGILGPIIDVATHLIKSKVKSNPKSVHETIVKYLPENVTVKVDASVEAIEGLADFLRNLVDELITLRDSTSVDEQLEAVDCIHTLMKNSLQLFNNEKFKKLLDKFMGKCYDVAEQSDVENAAMIDPSVAYPNLATPAVATMMYDDSVPVWMRNISDVMREYKDNKQAYAKPSFITQAAENAKASAEMKPMDPPIINPSWLVDPAVSKEYPWVNQVAAIAIKHNCAIQVNPIYTKTGEDSFTITSIRFVTSVNGNIVPSKSFTIDPGYIMDRRFKMFFNMTAQGFGWPESCQECYHVFDRSGKVLRDDIFNAVFTGGIDGISEKNKKGMRMYNSHTMQLNRVLDYYSLPTAAVRDDDRQALKDSAFKIVRIIKDFNAENNINLGRFKVTSFDPETMTYTIDNRNMVFMGQNQNPPAMTATVTIHKKDGKVVRDKDGKPELTFVPNWIDNVFGPNGPVYPKYMRLIIETKQSDSEVSESVDADADDAEENKDGDKPAIILNAGQEDDEGVTPDFVKAE